MTQYKGKLNCAECSHWRPVSDFKLSRDTRNNKFYIRYRCIFCRKIADEKIRRQNGISAKSIKSDILMQEIIRLGWSNKKISDIAQVNVRSVYDWIHRKRNIGLNAADNLCIYIGIDLNSLL